MFIVAPIQPPKTQEIFQENIPAPAEDVSAKREVPHEEEKTSLVVEEKFQVLESAPAAETF